VETKTKREKREEERRETNKTTVEGTDETCSVWRRGAEVTRMHNVL